MAKISAYEYFLCVECILLQAPPTSLIFNTMRVAAVNQTEAELSTMVSIVDVYQSNLFCDI